MKTILKLGTALLVSVLVLTGCAAETTPAPAPSPSASATANPTNTTAPTTAATEAPLGASGVRDAEQAVKFSEELEDQLEQLSEVSEAVVVIAGQNAAIGLTFDNQYQAGLTDRMEAMVKERLDGVADGITTVAVTDKETLINRIGLLRDQLENATDLTDVIDKLNALITSINTPGQNTVM